MKKKFDKNIKVNFFKSDKNFKTIVKTRFVDEVSKYKLFGSYILPDESSDEVEKKTIKIIKNKTKLCDIIIVSDYGHNFISKNILKEIKKTKKFLSVTAQINAANQGYHSINKFAGFDLMVINENELRQENKDLKTDIKILSKNLVKNKKINKLIVTAGKKGAFLIDKNLKSYYCPAFAKSSVDKVGAGDAMLSLTSLGLKLNFDPELVLFIGSIAAAISVESIGNKDTIDFYKLDRVIEHLLK